MQRGTLLLTALCFLGAGSIHAGQLQYIKITTVGGKVIQAPVKSFKGLSLGVVATLVKQGKMTNRPENPNKEGFMTFYLDKSVTSDFVVWASEKNATASTGRFQWVSSDGKATETFNMTGVHVIQFVTGGAKSANSGALVIVADETVATPPIDFSKKK